MRTKAAVLLLVLGLCRGVEAKKPPACSIPWPKVFAQARAQKIPAGPLIVLAPFRNDTELAGDEWIGFGLSLLLARYLTAADPTTAVLTQSQAVAAQKDPRYKIEGLFQHIQGWLRIFVQLKDGSIKEGSGELLGQWSIETPYPLHKQFFTGLNPVAQNILKIIGKKGVNAKALESVQNETSSVRAYENLIKGEMALEQYDPNQIEVAFIWFEEAIREDNRYIRPYLGLMEAYGFLSLVRKQGGAPFNRELEEVQNNLRLMKKKTGAGGENRFLSAHVHYVTGIRAFEAGNAAKSAEELQQAADLVPEDAAAAYALSQSYDKMGQPGLALKYRQRAKEGNPCL